MTVHFWRAHSFAVMHGASQLAVDAHRPCRRLPRRTSSPEGHSGTRMSKTNGKHPLYGPGKRRALTVRDCNQRVGSSRLPHSIAIASGPTACRANGFVSRQGAARSPVGIDLACERT